MKKILIILCLFFSVASYAQNNGGTTNGKSASGKSHDVGVDSLAPNRFALNTHDSLAIVWLTKQYQKIDSALKVLRRDSMVSESLLIALAVSQGSDISASRGQVPFFRVLSGLPSYAPGEGRPGTMTTDGKIRVYDDGVGITKGTVKTSAPTAYTNNSVQSLIMDSLGRLSTVDSVLYTLMYAEMEELNNYFRPLGSMSWNAQYTEYNTEGIPGMVLNTDTIKSYATYLTKLNRLDSLFNLIEPVVVNQIKPDINASKLSLDTFRTTGMKTIPTPNTISGSITTQNLVPARTATTGSAVILNVSGYGSALVQVKGTWSGTLGLQGTLDDTTWVTIANTNGTFVKITNGTSSVSITSDTTAHLVSTYGFKKIRVHATNTITGTCSIYMSTIQSSNMVQLSNNQNAPAYVTSSTIGLSANVAEDNASSNGASLFPIATVRSDTLTKIGTLTSANGDWTYPAADGHGVIITKDEATHRVTYRATSGSFTPAALATDIFTIAGVASKTIMITKIIFKATQTTGGTFNVSLIKRSTANTSGTAVAMTAVPLDASDAAAGSTVQYYTANPTLGTAIGSIETEPIFCSATGNATSSPEHYVFDFGSKGKPVILNSAAQALSLNFGGVTMTGGACFVTIEWTETW